MKQHTFAQLSSRHRIAALLCACVLSLCCAAGTVRTQHSAQRHYECANHLGNVVQTITDKKVQSGTTPGTEVQDPVVSSHTDYSPFGTALVGRNGATNRHRFGFNGMEHDGELGGRGNTFSTHFRFYDARLARWTSTDPLMLQFPGSSPYVAFANNPIVFKDPTGAAPETDGEGAPGIPMPGGTRPPREIDYTRLLADGKLDMGIAVGKDFKDEHTQYINYFLSQGFTEEARPPGQENGPRTFRGTKTMPDPHCSDQTLEIEVSVTLIYEGTDNVKEEFKSMLLSKEVFMYSGHSRDKVGPQFGRPNNQKTNFDFHHTYDNKELEKLSKERGFDPNLYQVCFMNACQSGQWVSSVGYALGTSGGRNGRVLPKASANYLFIASKYNSHSDLSVFLSGFFREQPIQSLFEAMRAHEKKTETKARSGSYYKTNY